MAPRLRIPDGGIPFRGGRPPRTNTNLGIRPEAGRAPQLPSGRTPGVKTEATLDAASNAGGGVGDWIMGGVSMIPGFGTAVAAGGAIGSWMEQNLPQNTAGSGRGSGRAAFNPPKPQASAQPRKVTPAGNYTVAGVTYDAKTGQAINPDTGKTSSGGYSIDPKSGARTDYQSGSGRGAAAPDGSGAQGTRTSPRPMTMEDANALLAAQTPGYGFSGPFSSNQLPASASSPYGSNGYQAPKAEDIPENMYSVRPKTMGKNLDMDLGPFDLSNAPDYDMSGVKIQSEMLRGSPNIANGGAAETAANTTSATDSPKSGTDPKNSGTNWGARTAADNSDKNMARRRAFLDGNLNSMQALRAIEAQKDVFYAGGQHHIVNPNRGQEGQNDFVAISKGDRDAYMGGRKTAEELKTQYVDKITAANAGQDASAMTPTDTLQETDISFESPAPTNPMKSSLEGAPVYQEAPDEYAQVGVDIKTKGKKFGF